MLDADTSMDCVVVEDLHKGNQSKALDYFIILFVCIIIWTGFDLPFTRIIETGNPYMKYAPLVLSVLGLAAVLFMAFSPSFVKRIIFTSDKIISVSATDELTILHPGDIKKVVLLRYWFSFHNFLRERKVLTLILVNKKQRNHMIWKTDLYVKTYPLQKLMEMDHIAVVVRHYPMTLNGLFYILVLAYVAAVYLQ